jgi:hypothetical protein
MVDFSIIFSHNLSINIFLEIDASTGEGMKRSGEITSLRTQKKTIVPKNTTSYYFL